MFRPPVPQQLLPQNVLSCRHGNCMHTAANVPQHQRHAAITHNSKTRTVNDTTLPAGKRGTETGETFPRITSEVMKPRTACTRPYSTWRGAERGQQAGSQPPKNPVARSAVLCGPSGPRARGQGGGRGGGVEERQKRRRAVMRNGPQVLTTETAVDRVDGYR